MKLQNISLVPLARILKSFWYTCKLTNMSYCTDKKYDSDSVFDIWNQKISRSFRSLEYLNIFGTNVMHAKKHKSYLPTKDTIVIPFWIDGIALICKKKVFRKKHTLLQFLSTYKFKRITKHVSYILLICKPYQFFEGLGQAPHYNLKHYMICTKYWNKFSFLNRDTKTLARSLPRSYHFVGFTRSLDCVW